MNIQQVENIIEENYKTLVSKLGENLISIFIIGSMKDENKELKQYNDYDLRILVNKFDNYTYKTILEFNLNIVEKIKQNLNIDVSYSFIIGPVRYITKSKINLLIHCIPMTYEILEGLPLTHKFSYASNYRIIYGKDVLFKYKKITYTGKDIITCTEGIDYCINMIKNNKIQYMDYKELTDGIELVRETKEMDNYVLFEVLRYSISKSLYNTMRWNLWQGRNSYEDIYSSIKEIDDKISLENIKVIEDLANGNFETYIKNINKYKDITLTFLNKIKKYIAEKQ